MSVFPNIDDIVIVIDSCRKFQPAQMNLVEFHIYVHMQNALGGEKLGENSERNGRILTPSERFLTFGVPVYGVKFHQN